MTSKFTSNKAIDNAIALNHGNVLAGEMHYSRIFRNSDSQSHTCFQNNSGGKTNYKKIVNKNKTNSNHAVVVNRVIKSPLEKHEQLSSVREERTVQQ
jgi:hypothetical protein